MESFRPQSETGKESLNEDVGVSLSKIKDLFDKNPASRKLVMAIGLAATLFGSEASADSSTESNVVDAKYFYSQIEKSASPDVKEAVSELKELHEKAEQEGQDVLWHASTLYMSDLDKVVLESDYPTFPKSGSGIFVSDSDSKMISSNDDGNVGLFEGMTYVVSISNDGENVVPVGDEHELFVPVKENVDPDQLISSALEDKLGYLTGIEIGVEKKSETEEVMSNEESGIKDTFSSESNQGVNTPIANWSLTNVVDEEGKITGYSVKFHLGEVVAEK